MYWNKKVFHIKTRQDYNIKNMFNNETNMVNDGTKRVKHSAVCERNGWDTFEGWKKPM